MEYSRARLLPWFSYSLFFVSVFFCLHRIFYRSLDIFFVRSFWFPRDVCAPTRHIPLEFPNCGVLSLDDLEPFHRDFPRFRFVIHPRHRPALMIFAGLGKVRLCMSFWFSVLPSFPEQSLCRALQAALVCRLFFLPLS